MANVRRPVPGGTIQRFPLRRRRRLRRPDQRGQLLLGLAALVLLLASVAAVLAAVDGDKPKASADRDPGPVHVHGLGIDPADQALFIATHTGLFRLDHEQPKPKRVAERHQDTMGFTVVGRNRFLGSGHPDLREAREKGLPSRLGLIESADAGETWKSVSLLGQSDFHVLRAAGARIYGYDATSGLLRVSRDGGKRWTRSSPPAPLLDLIPDPTNSRRVLATSQRGLHASNDEGRTWNTVGEGVGLLAWPTSRRLYLASGGGQLFVTPDAGKRWRQVGNIGGKPAALLAANARELYAALHNGTVMHSLNGGVSWAVHSKPS